MKPFDRLRLRTTQPPKLPPRGFIDLFHDAETDTLKTVDSAGTEAPLAGGSVTASSIAAATATDPDLVRQAAQAARITPALYEDFAAYADNATFSLSPASLPHIGNKWQWSRNNPNTSSPIVVNGALRGNTAGGTSLFYFGNDVGEPISVIGFELEFVGGGGGINNIGTTYAFHRVPVLTEGGNGIPGLSTPGMLHFEINQKGLSKMGFNYGTGANFELMQPMGRKQTGDGSVPYSDNPAGGDMTGRGRHVLTFRFVGDDCIVSVLGRSWIFRHPPAKRILEFSGQPADNDTFAVGGVTYRWKNTLAAANDVKIGASLAATITNAEAALNAAAGAGSLYGTGTVQNPLVRGAYPSATTLTFEARLAGPAGNAITCSESSAATSLAGGTLEGGERTPIRNMGAPRYWWYETDYEPATSAGYANLYRVWANAPESFLRQEALVSSLSSSGQVTLPQSMTFTGTATFTGAASFQGGLTNVAYSGFAARPVASNLETKTTVDTQSAAGSVYTSGSLLGMGGRTPGLGAVNVYELSGFFADTPNDRRIALNEAFTGDIFDSGNLAAGDVRNKMWRMRVTMQRTGSHSKRFVTEFQVSGSPPIIQTAATGTVTAANINFRTTSVATGDVQILTYHSNVVTI